jgi:hypothetical protein
MYSNKRVALHNAAETIIGKLDHSIQLHSKLAHKLTKKQRNNRRKKTRLLQMKVKDVWLPTETLQFLQA